MKTILIIIAFISISFGQWNGWLNTNSTGYADTDISEIKITIGTALTQEEINEKYATLKKILII